MTKKNSVKFIAHSCVLAKYGDFLILDSPALYSIGKNEIVFDNCDEITAFYEYFIVKFGNSYKLINQDLEVLIDNCQLISAYNNTLTIKINDKYALYKISELN